MTSRDFVYWLQGFLELSEQTDLTEKQLDLVKRHLNMVFCHEIDPSMGDRQRQQALSRIHAGIPAPSGGNTMEEALANITGGNGDPRIKC